MITTESRLKPESPRTKRKRKSVKMQPVPFDMWPTIRQEAVIRGIYSDSNGHVSQGKLAEQMGLPVNTIRAVVASHKKLRKNTEIGGPIWMEEQDVPQGKVVRCPRCNNRLTVWIPGHPLLGCRVCRMKTEERVTFNRRSEVQCNQ